jgi:hypothetical protein
VQDPGVYGIIILKWILVKRDGGGGKGTDWIDVAQDRNRWRALAWMQVDTH